MNKIERTIKDLKILIVALIIFAIISFAYVVSALYQQNSLVTIGFLSTTIISLTFSYFIHWVINIFKKIDIFLKKEIEEGRKEN